MALSTQGYFGTVTLVDNGNNTSTLRYDLTGADFATALSELQGIVTDLDTITDAVVKQYTVGEQYKETALVLPIGGVQVENRASISCLIAGEVDKYATLIVPAPVAGLFTGASGDAANIVDPADADLLTYLGHFVSGAEATVSDGEVIASPGAATVKGKRIHKASRRG